MFAFVYGQSDFSFKNISVKDGLAESTVKVIYEDYNGLMYLGTENGLDVYDGYEFNNYHMNSFDDNSILGNKVSSISEDKKGNIWVGTELGVSVFDPRTRTFSRPIFCADLMQSNFVSNHFFGGPPQPLWKLVLCRKNKKQD